MEKHYIVIKSSFDASRPYAVLRTFRSFNRVADRYPSKEQADRRARDLNKYWEDAAK